jgi:hypothetical protein
MLISVMMESPWSFAMKFTSRDIINKRGIISLPEASMKLDGDPRPPGAAA